MFKRRGRQKDSWLEALVYRAGRRLRGREGGLEGGKEVERTGRRLRDVEKVRKETELNVVPSV